MRKNHSSLNYGFYLLLQCDACAFEQKKPSAQARKAFYDAGWRAINKEILCPVCSGESALKSEQTGHSFSANERHKGRRFKQAINYIFQEYGANKMAIAERMGITVDMIYKYFRMPEFSNKVLFRLNALEDLYGINPKYFSKEDAKMLT